MDPITQVVTLGSSAASGEDTWFRANVRENNSYYRYPSQDKIYTVFDDNHIYYAYSIEVSYNGSNGYRTHRGEIWKVKKRDGSTVWHKSYENVDGAYEVFIINGVDISPNGNYLVISGVFNKEGVNYGNYGQFRYGFAELSTADGSLRTTANGALYAGAVKDDTANHDEERKGGILYKPGSNDDFIIPGEGGGPAYTGFARINRGPSVYTTDYHVDMYGDSPFNDYTTTNMTVKGIYRDPDNSNLMWLHREDYWNSYYHNYFLLYNVSGGTPTYVCGIRLRGNDFDGRALFTAKYTSSSDIDLYVHCEYSSTGTRLTKFTWDGSSWDTAWQNNLNVNNGGYGARTCHVLTYDDDNDRLVVWESDPPNTYVVRQINPSTGANVNIRRIAIDDDVSRTSWNMTAANTNGEEIANNYVSKNPCFRAVNGYVYASLQGLDTSNNAYQGHLAFKVSTDLSELPSTLTTYNTNVQGNNYHTPTMSFAISSNDPTGSYSAVTGGSIQGDYDNLASHTPRLYGSSQGPMQYYNWNESTCDEWLTAATDRWPSDIQIKID